VGADLAMRDSRERREEGRWRRELGGFRRKVGRE
jgi:hypothetical protein